MENCQKKKAFTTIEAVILFSVIALLAAILIPTFLTLREKARRSADEKAVLELNTVLRDKEKDGGKATGVLEAYAQVEEAGLTGNYVTLSKHLGLCYDKDNNRFVLYELNSEQNGGKVIYPAECVDDMVSDIKQNAEDEGRYYSLAKEASSIPSNDYSVGENGELLVDGKPLNGVNGSTQAGTYGLYYQDGSIFTGTIGDYTYENGMLVVVATNENGKFNYKLPSEPQYLTKKIILQTSGPNGIDETLSNAAISNKTVSQEIVVSNTLGKTYTLSSVSAKHSFDRIAELEKAISDGTAKEYIMNLYNGEETRNILPNITLGKDFIDYLKLKFNSETLTNEIYSNYLENYAFSENSFTQYLYKTYNERNIKDMGWSTLVSRHDEDINWGSKNGLIGGKNANEVDSTDFKVVEPEVVLTFWKLLYNNTFFTAVCGETQEGENAKLSEFISDVNTIDIENDVYSQKTSNWLSYVSNSYNINLYSWFDAELGIDVTGLGKLAQDENLSTLSFNLLAGAHQLLYSEIWSGCDIEPIAYEIIIETNSL